MWGFVRDAFAFWTWDSADWAEFRTYCFGAAVGLLIGWQLWGC